MLRAIGAFFLTATGIVLGTILIIAIVVGVWFFRVQTSDIRGKGDVEILVNSAPFRISAYDQFYNLCADVQMQEVSIDSQTANLKNLSGDALTRAQTNITAARIIRDQAIIKYNTESRKDYTVAQFKASDLPWQLPTDPYVAGGEQTSCGL